MLVVISRNYSKWANCTAIVIILLQNAIYLLACSYLLVAIDTLFACIRLCETRTSPLVSPFLSETVEVRSSPCRH